MAHGGGHSPDGSSENDSTGRTRLQRVMADAGVAARRVCERMIEEGRVSVNGQVVRRLPVFVDPESDEIVVEGKRLPRPERLMYLMLNKPAGTLVTAADEPGMDRPTVMSLIDHPSAPRLFPVGRLDFDSTGLVLLTNDGEVANRLTHPRYGAKKTYHALVKGNVDEAAVRDIRTKAAALGARVALEAREAGARRHTRAPQSAPEIAIVERDSGRTLLEITLVEARNRQLRDTLQLLGMPIKKLTRIGMGPLQLKGLAVGRWRELTRMEIQLVREAGTRREAKRRERGAARAAPARPKRRRGARTDHRR